jgi:hypothetical protein
VALVRVYCGLSSKGPAGPAGGEPLAVAVVDDSGRLLHVCDIDDSASGYADLGSVLAERSGGADVAVAADSDQHRITLLLAAAGRPLAIADAEALDDYADRFGDDDSPDELEAPLALRHAIGLARALQAGALGAAVLGAPRDLATLRPVLAAHAAVASGRQAAAVALREVLRELYPAALRAYPDPCEPVPLAILDALPEPGLLGSGSRSRDEAVVAQLSAAGMGDMRRLDDAVTALRVAISETPRRTSAGKSLTTALTETVRQSVAAVRACDTAVGALVGLLAEQTEAPSTGRRAALPTREAAPSSRETLLPTRDAARETLLPTRDAARETLLPTRDAARETLLPTREAAPSPREAPLPTREPATEAAPAMPRRTRTTIPPSTRSGGIASGVGATGSAAVPSPVAPPLAGAPVVPPTTSPTSAPPGPAHRQPDHLAPSHRSTGAHPAVAASAGYAAPPTSYAASAAIPSPRPGPDNPPPGSRADWPLTNSEYAAARTPNGGPVPGRGALDGSGYPLTNLPPTVVEPPSPPLPARNGRVAPPWQDEALSGDPPTLSLSDASAVAGYDLPSDADPLRFETPYDPPPLRLVEPDGGRLGAAPRMNGAMGGPVEADGDNDLLIFAEARSAWFTGHLGQQETSLDWNNPADLGWQAAERASEPILGEETDAGLPRRVPQANLVPGSALPPVNDRGLRIVRDPAAMAAHTTGYFRGSRRGEEVRGFAVGGRPGRESAGGWDFARDSWEGDEDEYRPAARQ